LAVFNSWEKRYPKKSFLYLHGIFNGVYFDLVSLATLSISSVSGPHIRSKVLEANEVDYPRRAHIIVKCAHFTIDKTFLPPIWTTRKDINGGSYCNDNQEQPLHVPQYHKKYAKTGVKLEDDILVIAGTKGRTDTTFYPLVIIHKNFYYPTLSRF